MKTIYIANKISDQNGLSDSIKKINGKITTQEREQIHRDFNDNVITEISISVNIAFIGGVHYKKNGHDIELKFVGDIVPSKQKEISDRIQHNIK